MNRKSLAIFVAELVGTFVLSMIVLAASTQALQLGTRLQGGGSLVLSGTLPGLLVAASAGLALAIMVGVIGPVSGAHINPAVTASMLAMRMVSLKRAILYVVAQGLGAVLAWRTFIGLVETNLRASDISGFDWQVLIAEAIGTAIFVMGIAAVVTKKIEGLQAMVIIGSSLFLGLVIASIASRAILNPAVAVAVRGLDYSYFFGPVIGGLVGMTIYTGVIAPEVAKKAVPSASLSQPAKSKTAKKVSKKK